MRWSQPNKDQPAYCVPETREDAEELELRESRESDSTENGGA